MNDPAQTPELDLTTEQPADGPVAPIELKYDPEPERERVRGRIAQALTIGVLVIAILASSLLAGGALERDDLEPLQVFYTPLITLTGTALGFYFGGLDRKR